MDLYQRLEKALDDGIRMSALEHCYWPLRERLEDHGKLTGSSSPTARDAGFIFGSLDIQLIDECTEQTNELRSERTKRMYASGNEKLSRLETFVENFGYALGHKIEDLRQWHVGMKRKHEVKQYHKRRLRSIENGWTASQFFAEEAKRNDKKRAKKRKGKN